MNEELKRKLINISEILLWVLVVVLAVIFVKTYVIPKQEIKKDEIIKENARIFTKAILDDYNITKKKYYDIKESTDKVIEELNSSRINPYNKKQSAYVLNDTCRGCLSVVVDEKIESVVISALDSDKHILTRTVIKPPSYVGYEKPIGK